MSGEYKQYYDGPGLFLKVPNWISQPYKDWLKEACVCIFTDKKATPHHLRCLGWGGTGLKPPDSHCLPINQSVIHLPVHGYGELGVLKHWIPGGPELDDEIAKGWLAMKCLEHISMYLSLMRIK